MPKTKSKKTIKGQIVTSDKIRNEKGRFLPGVSQQKFKEETNRKGGRQSEYLPEYADLLIKFFDRPVTETIQVERITKSGEVVTLNVEVAAKLPTIEGFCRSLLISKQTFFNWTKSNPEFMDAYNIVKPIQADILFHNSLAGRYKENFAKFMAVNITDYRDKVEQNVTHSGIEDLQNALKSLPDVN